MPEADSTAFRRRDRRVATVARRGPQVTPHTHRPSPMTSSRPDDESTLEALMRAAQDGDKRAYAQLLKTVTPRLQKMVRAQRRFLDAADTDDIVQDVLVSLHAVRATYDPRRPFMPWLMAIARNRLADSGRRDARRNANEVVVHELPVTFSEEEANIANSYGDPEALHRAIKGLPPGQREAVEMLKLREMSLKEAAAASGTSAGALKVSVHRAMTTLRKVLNAGGGHGN